MFHLGWFLGAGFGIQPWNTGTKDGVWNGTNSTEWMKPDLYIDLTVSLERGGYDYILIEDTAMVEDTYGGSMETTLRRGFMAPKNDPLPLVPLLSRATKHIGIVPTLSSIQYHPFMAARLITTLDHLTEGRIGLNVVTSVTDRVAQNYGYEKHFEHDERYVMAEEWMEVIGQLWESWEPGAVRIDENANIYADHTKVHPIEFQGKYFSSRGPLNTIPGPQRRPVIAQAGGSIPGRELAAKNANTMLVLTESAAEAKAFREDMHARLAAHGRDVNELKVMFIVTPIIGETDADAQRIAEAKAAAGWEWDQMEYNLWNMSYITGGRTDYSKFDLDSPMPQILGNGEQSSIKSYLEKGANRTLREMAATHFQVGPLGMVGSPDTVAAKMGEFMEEVGGDGFLVYAPTTRRTIAEFTDGLSTALRRRGLIRSGFDHTTFKENLLDF
ncbi:MAG: NtaA/DmoA family FMN-dependent monooxygenase [Frankia sp.]